MRPAISTSSIRPSSSSNLRRKRCPSCSTFPMRALSIRPRSSPNRASTPWRCAARRMPTWMRSSHPSAELGAPLMAARFPRAYLDLNREPYELDSRMFDGTRSRPSPIPARCASPAGSARSRGSSPTGRKSIADAFRVDEALRRIEWLYKPYHRMLRQLVRRTAADVRRGNPDRRPFDAVEQRQSRRGRQSRHGAG